MSLISILTDCHETLQITPLRHFHIYHGDKYQNVLGPFAYNRNHQDCTRKTIDILQDECGDLVNAISEKLK